MLSLDLKPYTILYYNKKPIKVWTSGNHSLTNSISLFSLLPSHTCPSCTHSQINIWKQKRKPAGSSSTDGVPARDLKAELISPGGFSLQFITGPSSPAPAKAALGKTKDLKDRAGQQARHSALSRAVFPRAGGDPRPGREGGLTSAGEGGAPAPGESPA